MLFPGSYGTYVARFLTKLHWSIVLWDIARDRSFSVEVQDISRYFEQVVTCIHPVRRNFYIVVTKHKTIASKRDRVLGINLGWCLRG